MEVEWELKKDPDLLIHTVYNVELYKLNYYMNLYIL